MATETTYAMRGGDAPEQGMDESPRGEHMRAMLSAMQAVAQGMAVVVVEALEPIDVDHQDADRIVRPPAARARGRGSAS